MYPSKNFVKNWLVTVRAILTHPHLFYRNMPVSGPLKEPISFALFTIFIISLLNIPITLYFWSSFLPIIKYQMFDILIMGFLSLYTLISMFIFVPVNTLLNHFGFKISDAKGGQKATLRVICYSFAVSFILFFTVAVMVIAINLNKIAVMKEMLHIELNPIFLLGAMITVGYSFYVLLVGFSEVHSISMKRAFFAVAAIPLVIGFILSAIFETMQFISHNSKSLGTGVYFPDEYQYYKYGNGNPQPIMPTLVALNKTPPLVDGYYSPDDRWDETRPIKFMSGSGNGTIAAKHDGQMLYILIMRETEQRWITPLALYFEQDAESHDHKRDTGLINEKYNSTVGYTSNIFYDTHNDEEVKISRDGIVRSNYSNGMWVQEWAIPLNSGEYGDIVVDKIPSTLGFALLPRGRSQFDWPSIRASSRKPLTWGDLKIIDSDVVGDTVQQFNITAPYGRAPWVNGHYNYLIDGWYETEEIGFISGGIVYGIAAKHDDENLYIILKWEGSSQLTTPITLYFEQDGNTHDHNLSTGRDDYKSNTATLSKPDSLYDGSYARGTGEKFNGRVVSDISYGMWVQEWVIPLNYNNPGDIYVNQTPTTLGFAIIERGWGYPTEVWPPGASPYSPETWGDLELLPKK